VPHLPIKQKTSRGEKSAKWEQRSQPVIYLGKSPKHTSLVALVMDLETAHVSLQFHLKFDDLFETVSATRQNPQAQNSQWQQLCHFSQKEGKDSVSSEKGSCPSPSNEVNNPGRMDMTTAMQVENDQLGLPDHFLDEEQFQFPEGGESAPEGALTQVEQDQVPAQTVEGTPLR
jgi:hypothetical protein